MDVLDQILPQAGSGAPPAAVAEPGLVARRLTAMYRRWDQEEQIDLVAVARGLLDRLGTLDSPLAYTCLQAAEAVACWGGHEFHSARHHAEVATNTMLIAELACRLGQPVPPHQGLLLLASALAHDLYYDAPPGHPPLPFQAEARSARALDEIADRCGVADDDREALNCLVLATEPSFRKTLRSLMCGVCSCEAPPGLLAPMFSRPALVQLACMLSDGDLLSSAGLTPHWHHVQVMRLERERGRRMDQSDDAEFLDRIVGPGFLSIGGRWFDANLARIRAHARLRHKSS
jgi:hypothetical protein